MRHAVGEGPLDCYVYVLPTYYVPVGRVDLGNVAEKSVLVDLCQDVVGLEVAKAVEEQLREKVQFHYK